MATTKAPAPDRQPGTGEVKTSALTPHNTASLNHDQLIERSLQALPDPHLTMVANHANRNHLADVTAYGESRLWRIEREIVRRDGEVRR